MSTVNAPVAPIRSNRVPGRIVFWLGLTCLVAGAGAVVWGSLLPWLTVNVFDLPLVLPGVVGLGAATAAIGLLAVTRLRSAPILNLLLGLACIGIGNYAQQTLGRATARQILGIKQRLAPINARLEQVNLPPIEPFSQGVVARNYVGPGPTWTIWGGVLLALGGTTQFAGGRLERTCAHCGRFRTRGRTIYFCPYCGAPDRADERCGRCFTSFRRGDRFCAHCGLSRHPETPS